MPRSQRPRSASPRRNPRPVRARAGVAGINGNVVERIGGLVPQAPQSLPVEVARVAQREMDRLRRLPSGTPEAAQVRGYLQWLWSLPWETTSPEDALLNHVEASLDREHLGLNKVKERVLEYLAVRQLKPDLPGP